MNFIMNEQHYKDIYNYLNALILPKTDDELRKTQIKSQSKNYFIQSHQLFRRRKNGQPQRVILPEQTELILFNLHKDPTGAHLGIESTYDKLKERYYWPQMYESVRSYVRNCDNCQCRGKLSRKEELKPIYVDAPFHKIGTV